MANFKSMKDRLKKKDESEGKEKFSDMESSNIIEEVVNMRKERESNIPQTTPKVVEEEEEQNNKHPNTYRVYEPIKMQVDEIDFSEIRDSKGLIKNKVLEMESTLGLSVLPFDILGLHPNVVEIKDYDIISIGNKKYVSSSEGIRSKQVVDFYINKWCDIISCGGKVDESLFVSKDCNGSKIRTLALTKFEMDYVLNVLRQANVKIIITDDDIKLVGGIV